MGKFDVAHPVLNRSQDPNDPQFSSPDDPQLLQTYAHTFFCRYLHEFMVQIYESTNDDLDSEILLVVDSAIIEISVALNDFASPRSDFLF